MLVDQLTNYEKVKNNITLDILTDYREIYYCSGIIDTRHIK